MRNLTWSRARSPDGREDGLGNETKRNEMMNKPVELNISCTTPVRFLCVINPGQGGGGSVKFVDLKIPYFAKPALRRP